MTELSIVIPCFDEEHGLPELRRRLDSLAPYAAGRWEAVLVDDASRDGTWNLIRDWAAHDPRLTVLRLSANAGTQAALLTGVGVARGAAVAFLDADLQDPPEMLETMLSRLENEGLDAVIGRKTRRRDGGLLTSCLKAAAVSVLPMVPGESDFCVLSRAAARRLLATGGNEEPVRVRRRRALALRPVAYQPYERAPRAQGDSRYDLVRNARLWWSFALGFYRPGAAARASFVAPAHETSSRRPR